MVYCTKCGAKNEDDALICVKCGASLEAEEYTARRYTRRRWEDECFGLPHGGSIVGMIFGIIIIVLGLTWLAGINIWDYIGPLFVIIIGVLIIAGVAYSKTRR